MKFVLTKVEVAEALQMTPDELDGALPALFAAGFPKPVEGIGERWSIVDVMLWVNRAAVDHTVKTKPDGFAEPDDRRQRLN